MLSRSVRDNAIGGVIAGVVLAILATVTAKVTGRLPQLWNAGRNAATWLSSLLGGRFSLTLRGWAWIIVWLLLVVIARAFWRLSAPETSSQEVTEAKWPQLDELESAIMRLLAEMDGQSVFLTDLSMRLQNSQLRVGKALERLEAVGFIAPEHNVLHGTKAGLTRQGRDYILDHGMAR